MQPDMVKTTPLCMSQYKRMFGTARIAEEKQDSIKVDAKSLTVDKVSQSYIVVKNMQKKAVLENILLLRQDQKIIIFGQTKRSCDEIYDFLKERKYRAGKTKVKRND